MHLNRKIICVVILLCVAAGSITATLLLAQQVDSDRQIASVILADLGEFNREAWANDPYSFQVARIEGDMLQLTVSYSGGCAEHQFNLVAWNYFLESNPVQAHVLLAHNGNDDACDAIIARDLRFDLSPLKEAYQQFISVNLRWQILS
jgi:hypothetical protein